MKSVLFLLKDGFQLASALKELDQLGLTEIYTIEDALSSDTWIGGLIKEMPDDSALISITLRGPNEVNWSHQWESNAENFQNGLAHIDLNRFGKDATLHLLAGEGFGDLSHPTTYLMLDMMTDKMEGENVIDIGSGSGILALSAKLMGADQVLGVEIEQSAVRHAEKNALKNHLDVPFTTHLENYELKKGSLFLMNMTLAEQVGFMKDHQDLPKFAKTWITSGILSEQKDKYLEQIKSWGWSLEETRKKDKWLGFIFSQN